MRDTRPALVRPAHGLDAAMHLLAEHGKTRADLTRWQTDAGEFGPDTKGSIEALHDFLHDLDMVIGAGHHGDLPTTHVHLTPSPPQEPGDAPADAWQRPSGPHAHP